MNYGKVFKAKQRLSEKKTTFYDYFKFCEKRNNRNLGVNAVEYVYVEAM